MIHAAVVRTTGTSPEAVARHDGPVAGGGGGAREAARALANLRNRGILPSVPVAPPVVQAPSTPPAPELPRHCWVQGVSDYPGQWPGVVAQWRKSPTGDWQGFTVIAIEDAGDPVVIQSWLNARHLKPL